jgi:hypothetical protein
VATLIRATFAALLQPDLETVMQRLFAEFARGTPYGRVVSMLFALLRRNVFQSRFIALRLSDRGDVTGVTLACLFWHG